MKNKTLILIPVLAVIMAVSGCGKKDAPKSAVSNNTNAQQVNANVNENQDAGAVEDGQNGEQGEEIDTSDWLTYRNEEYGYQIKYPKNWHINFPQGYGRDFPKGQVVSISSGDYDDPYYAPLEIFVHDREGKSFEDWHMSMYPHPDDITELRETKKIIYNNIEFVVFNDGFGSHYYAIKNDKFVRFSLMDGPTDEKKGSKMMETIVFTFEFID